MSEPELPSAPFHRLRVRDIVEETLDSRSVHFTVPAGAEDAFFYRPGQFLTLRVPSERTGSVARCYSLCSSPYVDAELTVTVKRVADGYGSNWICDNLAVGMDVDVLPPSGVFTPKSLDGDLLLFAGGSGITPVMAIMKSVLAAGSGTVVLVYANRDEHSVIFADELQRLAEKHPERLTVIHWLESVQGLPGVPMLRTLAAPFAEHEAFVCGPAAFMGAVKQALRELGFPKKRRHIETFVSLAGNPFESAESAPAEQAPADPGSASDASVTVTLDGETATYSWPRQQKLLDMLLGRGLDAPFSCREGQCSACAYRLLSGEVHMLHNEILEQEDLDEDIRLGCQSLPVSDTVEISYE